MGGDISGEGCRFPGFDPKSFDDVANECRKRNDCLAFTTVWCLKNQVETPPPHILNDPYTTRLCAGIYVKRCRQFEGWSIHEGLDSAHNDLDCTLRRLPERTVAELWKACEPNPDCAAFSTSGCLKKVLAPKSKWQVYANTDTKIGECAALYVKTDVPVAKRCAQFPGYDFEPNRDSDRGDIEGSPFELDMKSLAEKCTAQPTCKAFNTGGYLKDDLKPKAEWKAGQQSDDPCTGLYVRQSTDPVGTNATASSNATSSLQDSPAPVNAAPSTIVVAPAPAPVVVAPALVAPAPAPEKAGSSGGSREVIVPVVAGTFTVLGVLITGSYTLWKWQKKKKLAAAGANPNGAAQPDKVVAV